MCGSACLGREKKRKKSPAFCGIRTGDQQVGTWGSTRREPSGSSEAYSLPLLIPFILVLYMLMHTRPSLTCLLLPGFTRCTTADLPEAHDMEAGKPTAPHREPSLQLKQRNHRPQTHSQLVSQTHDFISTVIFSRSLLSFLPADIMWLLL